MAVSEQLKRLVDQMPDPDGRGMFTENIDKDKIEKAVAAIHQGGRDNVQGLIDMLGVPGSREDVKPRYALHCVNNYALVAKDENSRRQICETIAKNLERDDVSKENKAFFCECLQWSGRRESVAVLGKLLLDEDLVEPAVMALTAIRDGAGDVLRAALPQATGKCRMNIVQGLSAVEDKAAIPTLREALRDDDREVRLAAGWGLSRMGDEGSVDALIKAADVPAGWERIQSAKHCMILAEKLLAAGKKDAALKLYNYLKQSRNDPSEKYLRDAAEKAIAAA